MQGATQAAFWGLSREWRGSEEVVGLVVKMWHMFDGQIQLPKQIRYVIFRIQPYSKCLYWQWASDLATSYNLALHCSVIDKHFSCSFLGTGTPAKNLRLACDIFVWLASDGHAPGGQHLDYVAYAYRYTNSLKSHSYEKVHFECWNILSVAKISVHI